MLFFPLPIEFDNSGMGITENADNAALWCKTTELI